MDSILAPCFCRLRCRITANIASAGEIVLAENGQSPYQIVVADKASPSTKHAAEELQKYLQQMTGAKLPIVSDQQPARPQGDHPRRQCPFARLKTGIDVASLGKEGYVIRTVGDNLVIVGGQLRGNMYGVYGLLEDHLGCRWFTPDVSRIPKSHAIGDRPDRRPADSRAWNTASRTCRLSRRRVVRPEPHELEPAGWTRSTAAR